MKSIGRSYKQHPVTGPFDAIVIGSGIGGLTTAALLAKHAGKRVLVLERHYTAGGFTHVFRRPDYEWDVGVHYIGRVNKPGVDLRPIFDYLTEGRLGWCPMPDVYDRIRIGQTTYEFPTGTERFREQMKRYFPGEARAIDRYLAAVHASVAAMGAYFAEKAVPRPIARLVGGLMRRRFLRYSDRTTSDVLNQLTSNRELIAVLTGQWGDYGLPPAQSSFAVHATIAHHYLEGAAYPVGGASEIAASIAPLIERAGGEIVVSAEVKEILVDSRGRATGVGMADGREIHSGIVISDAGAYNTFAQLLPASGGAHQKILSEIRTIPPSMSHLCLYVGLRRSESEPEFDASNLWVYNDADHDANVARFAENPDARFPALFISFPSAKDPTFARRYPRRSTIEIVAPIAYGPFERWAETRWKKRGADYDALKQQFAARLLDELNRQVPTTRGKVDYSELSTPLSTRHFANYPHGEIYGLSALPARFRLRDLGSYTPIANLYLTGQDVGVLGVTGALAGGAIAASAIVRRNLIGVMSSTVTPNSAPVTVAA